MHKKQRTEQTIGETFIVPQEYFSIIHCPVDFMHNRCFIPNGKYCFSEEFHVWIFLDTVVTLVQLEAMYM